MNDDFEFRIGDVDFTEAFGRPNVNVKQEFRTAEHEIIQNDARDSAYGVQIMGRKPTRITISGTVSTRTATLVQELSHTSRPVFIFSSRWYGTATIKQINSVEQTNFHDGQPTHQLTIECREIAENIHTEDAIPETDWDPYRGVSDLSFTSGLQTGHRKLSNWTAEYQDSSYIGRLELRDRYSNPPADVSINSKADEHGLLSPEETQTRPFNVDSKGSEPDRITIDAVVPESDIRAADELGRNGRVAFDVSERYWGTGIVKSVSTTDRNEYDDILGEWIHDCKIELISIGHRKMIPPAVFPPEASRANA